jgi:hypothetical protein
MFGSHKHLCLQNGSIHFFLVANKKLLLLNFIMLVDDLESMIIYFIYFIFHIEHDLDSHQVFHISHTHAKTFGRHVHLISQYMWITFFVFMDRLCLCHCLFIINVLHKLLLVEVEHFRHVGLIYEVEKIYFGVKATNESLSFNLFRIGARCNENRCH